MHTLRHFLEACSKKLSIKEQKMTTQHAIDLLHVQRQRELIRVQLETLPADGDDQEGMSLSQEMLAEAIAEVLRQKTDEEFLEDAELRKAVRKQIKERSPGLKLTGFSVALQEATRRCALLQAENGGYRLVRSHTST